MGGGGSDPYDNILAVCQQLSPIQPVSIQPLPVQTVVLGVFDVQAMSFTWDSGIKSKTRTVTEWDIGSNGKPEKITYTVTDYFFDSIAVSVQLIVLLVNNVSSNVTFTAGDQTTFAPAGTAAAVVAAPFSGNIPFTLTVVGNPRSYGELVHADRSHFSNFSGSLQQPGCVVVPALPIAIVYQPPTSKGRGIFDSAQSLGVSVTSISASNVGPTGGTPGNLADINQAILALQQVSRVVSVAGVGAANPYIAAIGIILGALTSFLQLVTSSGTPGVKMEITAASTLQLTFTQENTFYSSADLGPGAGDVIVYLKDATFAVYGVNGNYTLVPLGFNGLTPAAIPAAALIPGAAQPADLPENVRAQLLALDPIASGNPDGLADTTRFSHVGDFTLSYPIEQKFTWSFTKQVSTAGPKLVTEVDTDGHVVNVKLGTSVGAIQGTTTQTSLDVTGPAHFEIWYDSFFDTFAYKAIQQTPGTGLSFEGTLTPTNGMPLLGQVVTLVQNGRRVSTLTDAQGHYLLQSPSFQPGPAQLELPDGTNSILAQAVTLAFS